MEAGSLIQLHKHKNFEVLELLEDSDGKLYYKGIPIYTAVSTKSNNAIITLADGIYVDGSCFLSGDQYDLLTGFSYKNGELYYNDVIVSREYQDNAIYDMITAVWAKLNAEYPENPVETQGILTADSMEFITKDNKIFVPGGETT